MTSSLGSLVHSFFTDYLPLQTGLRLSSIRSYRDTIRLFLCVVSGQRRHPISTLVLDDLTLERVLAFLKHLEQDRGNLRTLFYAHESEIDLVISDSVMPRLGGVEVYEALRSRQPPIRFLLASGYSPTSLGHPHHPTVDVPFLRKPWTLSELARRIRAVLDGGA